MKGFLEGVLIGLIIVGSIALIVTWPAQATQTAPHIVPTLQVGIPGNVTVFHDSKRLVTCYELANSLSCLPDSEVQGAGE